jgi:trehalose utilization protein
MGMPCVVNSIVKLGDDYPITLELNATHQATKSGYRIFAIDVPLQLVDANWLAHGEVIIDQLTWQAGATQLTFRIARIYDTPFAVRNPIAKARGL